MLKEANYNFYIRTSKIAIIFIHKGKACLLTAISNTEETKNSDRNYVFKLVNDNSNLEFFPGSILLNHNGGSIDIFDRIYH